MKILHVSYADNGGATHFFAEAVKRHTDHQVRSIRMKQNYLDYPVDLLSPGKKRIRELFDWCDIMHIHDNAHHILDTHWQLKPALHQYHGTAYRRSPAACHQHNVERGWLVAVSTIDLSLHGKTWLPSPRPDMIDMRSWKRRSKKRFVVMHAPTVRSVKNTDEVVNALGKAPGIDLRLIEQVSYSECIRRKGEAHLLVDQFILGFGNNATEVWAMGIPVIANAMENIAGAKETLMGLSPAAILDKMRQEIGYLPFFQSTPNAKRLRADVCRMRDSAKLWNEWADRGRQFWQDFHSPQACARIIEPMYQEAMELFGSARRETIGRYGLNDAPSRKRPATVDQSDLVLIRYLGGNDGIETWFPDGPECTPTKYEFGRRRADGYVYAVDAAWFLGLQDKRKRPLFAKVK